MSLGQPVVGSMNLGVSEKLRPLLDQVRTMVQDEMIPLEREFEEEVGKAGDRFVHTARQLEILDGLKAKARERGLWNFWLTDSYWGLWAHHGRIRLSGGGDGQAPPLGAETFNCSAPDTGNMQVLETMVRPSRRRVAGAAAGGQDPLRLLMTEPGWPLTRPTCLDYGLDGRTIRVLNGRKWWARRGHPRCKIYIVMGHTDPEAANISAIPMVLVPGPYARREGAGACPVYGDYDAPYGHGNQLRERARAEGQRVLGPGAASKWPRAGLGPGRLHHCMARYRARRAGRSSRCAGAPCRARPSATSWRSWAPITTSSRKPHGDRHGAPALTLKAA